MGGGGGLAGRDEIHGRGNGSVRRVKKHSLKGVESFVL